MDSGSGTGLRRAQGSDSKTAGSVAAVAYGLAIINVSGAAAASTADS